MKTPSPPTILTTVDENVLKEWILVCGMKGFPRHKLDVGLSITEFLELNTRENTFKNSISSRGWFRNFLKRYPELTERPIESVSAASTNVSEKNLKKCFRYVQEMLVEEFDFVILKDRTRIFNSDETSFILNLSTGTKIYA